MLAAAWTEVFSERFALFLVCLFELLLELLFAGLVWPLLELFVEPLLTRLIEVFIVFIFLFIFLAHLEELFCKVGDDLVVAVDELAIIVEIRNQIRIATECEQFLVRHLLLDIALVQIDIVLIGKMSGHRARLARCPVVKDRP